MTALRIPQRQPDPAAPPADEPSPAAVILDVLDRWGVRRAEVMSGSRRRRVSLARRACIVALRRDCPSLSLADIGAELGGLNHSSVLYALRMAGVAS